MSQYFERKILALPQAKTSQQKKHLLEYKFFANLTGPTDLLKTYVQVTAHFDLFNLLPDKKLKFALTITVDI